MKSAVIILLGLALVAHASTRSPNKARSTWFQQLKGWQKLFGVVAIVLTLLIALNPEVLALGLFADTAFFDLFVLALSLQMHTYAARVFHACVGLLSRGFRWLGIPSPGLSYLMAVLTVAFASVVSIFQKALNRIFS